MEGALTGGHVAQTRSPVDWPPKRCVLGVNISATNYSEAVLAICDHARQRLGGAVSALAIHGLMLGTRLPEFGRRLNEFELATPDGQGVRWALNLLHRTRLDDRVYGPELALRVAHEAAQQGLALYLFGSQLPATSKMKSALLERFPTLQIVGLDSPSAWPMTRLQDEACTQRIRESGAHIVLVGLGCPRQEDWIHSHRQQLDAVLIGIGAAFDFISGAKRQAPWWAQRYGLEMVFRTCMEPRRLWRRLLFYSPDFVVRVLAKWLLMSLSGPNR